MKIDVITLFPKLYENFLTESIIGKAIEKELVEVNVYNLRDWAVNDYGRVDDSPVGGGAGMVLMVEPVEKALRALKGQKTRVIALTAKGETFKQSTAKRLVANYDHLILLAGHYEGFDQRILDNLVDEQISIGNYVLTGGELPSMVLMDSIIRLIPTVLGNKNSPVSDSFYDDDTTVQYPQYTKPATFTTETGEEWSVPEVLLSGHHVNIEKWREENKDTRIKIYLPAEVIDTQAGDL